MCTFPTAGALSSITTHCGLGGHWNLAPLPMVAGARGSAELIIRAQFCRLCVTYIALGVDNPVKAVLGLDIANCVLHINLSEQPLAGSGQQLAEHGCRKEGYQALRAYLVASKVAQYCKSNLPTPSKTLSLRTDNPQALIGIGSWTMAPHLAFDHSRINDWIRLKKQGLWVAIGDQQFQKAIRDFRVLGRLIEDDLWDAWRVVNSLHHSIADPIDQLITFSRHLPAQLEEVKVEPGIISDVYSYSVFFRFEFVMTHALFGPPLSRPVRSYNPDSVTSLQEFRIRRVKVCIFARAISLTTLTKLRFPVYLNLGDFHIGL